MWNLFLDDRHSRLYVLRIEHCLQSYQQRDNYSWRGNIRSTCFALWILIAGLGYNRHYIRIYRLIGLLQHAIWRFSLYPESNSSHNRIARSSLTPNVDNLDCLWTCSILLIVYWHGKKWRTSCRRKVWLLHARPPLLSIQPSHEFWRSHRRRRSDCRHIDNQNRRNSERRRSYSSSRPRRWNSW